MFDISPVCQANLALWHAITGLITAVCGLEGTQAGLAALTGPDRLIRSAGTQNSNSQTPHISLLAHNSLQVQKSIVAVIFLPKPDAASRLPSLLNTMVSLTTCSFIPHTNTVVLTKIEQKAEFSCLPMLLHRKMLHHTRKRLASSELCISYCSQAGPGTTGTSPGRQQKQTLSRRLAKKSQSEQAEQADNKHGQPIRGQLDVEPLTMGGGVMLGCDMLSGTAHAM
ncbi:hypothetical protein NQZ68_003383 [Dissostichus eleginoides]|nr:hypothetical protein NQZ68_003383 [Dissostichus eleginoides]